MTELACLALVIYHEARAEPLVGQVAVAEVVLNRVASDAYPDTVCGVVEQGYDHKPRCAFSFYCDGKPDTPYEKGAWIEAQIVAHLSLHEGVRVQGLEHVLNYHADYVHPSWAASMRVVAHIGKHIFLQEQ